MEAFIGLLLVIGILGGGFLLLGAIGFGIVFLLDFIVGESDWEYKYNEYRRKQDLEFQPWKKPGWTPKDKWMNNDNNNDND